MRIDTLILTLLLGVSLASRQHNFNSNKPKTEVKRSVNVDGNLYHLLEAEINKIKPNFEQLEKDTKETVNKLVVEGKQIIDNFSKYVNHKVVSIRINNKEELNLVENYVEKNLVDVWTPLRQGIVDINIPSSSVETLKQLNLTFTTKIASLSEAIKRNALENLETLEEVFDFSSKNKYKFEPRSKFYRKFNNLDVINEKIDALVQKYDKVATKVTLGKSYEGRNINGIKIEKKNNNGTKLVVFHGGQHSREWISVATTTYMLESILRGYNQPLSSLYKVLDKYSFVIIPVLNVDGYHYTFTEDRMWRKNREPTSLPWCPGVDMNRNWDAHWGNKGASSSPCSEAYHGPSPFSATELKVLTNFLKEQSNLIAYLDFHAYSQLFMFPYGYDCAKKPKGFEDLDQVSKKVVQAIRQPFNTKFVQGGICTTIYQASGSSVDWTFDTLGVKYSFAVELRDTGNHGFLLPPNQIIPSGHETLQGLTAMLEEIAKIENF